MSLRDWSYVELKGDIHAIPQMCPNCLEPGDQALRTQHVGLCASLFCPLPYRGPEQTFYYCPNCIDAARAGARVNQMRRFLWWWPSLMALLLVAGGVFAIFVGPFSPLHEHWKAFLKATNQWAMLIIPVTAIVLGMVLWRVYRRRQMKRFPKREDQAVWGVAAYCTDYGRYYTPYGEWIVALVEANPNLVDDDTYRAATGRDRPDEPEEP